MAWLDPMKKAWICPVASFRNSCHALSMSFGRYLSGTLQACVLKSPISIMSSIIQDSPMLVWFLAWFHMYFADVV